VLPRERVLRALTWLLLVVQRFVPKRFGLPRLTRASLQPITVDPVVDADAYLFTGCVMDAWLRDTHRSTVRVMQAAGAQVALAGGCCGALHVHAGRGSEARDLARRVIDSIPGDAPVVVNSAGCGAAMKDYGHLLGTPEAKAFAARVRDFSEWLATQPAVPLEETGRVVVVQDPCHLRHVQKAHAAVREVLAPAYALRDTDDEGLCCGAGGAYAALQPELSSAIRDRKVDAIRRASGNASAIVASANPGCMMHLRAAGLDVRHPADLLAEALHE
jgi:glycolate oxidase iron-sulfur subunit